MAFNRLYETANHQSLLKNNYKKRGMREPNNLAVKSKCKGIKNPYGKEHIGIEVKTEL